MGEGFAPGDLNADGNPDIVTDNVINDTYSHNVSVFLSMGDGALVPRSMYEVGVYPSSVALGDLNADGKLDIVTGNTSSKNLSVLSG